MITLLEKKNQLVMKNTPLGQQFKNFCFSIDF